LATYVSHNRVAKIAREKGNKKLAKMCKIIAGDEMRHHNAYSEFVERIFKVDPSQMMLAFQYMMKQKIVMPALFLRESGNKIGLLIFGFRYSIPKSFIWILIGIFRVIFLFFFSILF
jgi:acyl-[acyl-carrier-protein] desaturase